MNTHMLPAEETGQAMMSWQTGIPSRNAAAPARADTDLVGDTEGARARATYRSTMGAVPGRHFVEQVVGCGSAQRGRPIYCEQMTDEVSRTHLTCLGVLDVLAKETHPAALILRTVQEECTR